MDKDLVVGLDSSTTSTKAIAFARDGKAVGEGRCPMPISKPAPNLYEQEAGEWWAAAAFALDSLTKKVDPDRIAGIGISNQRESFVPLDDEGMPVRPAIIWLDRRALDEVPRFAAKVGEERIHRITGKPVDVAPVCYRIAWMRRHEPARYQKTAMFADVHAYLAWRLTGRFQTSWASADPLGLFDIEKKVWSEEVLSVLELAPGRLPEAMPPGAFLGEITDPVADDLGCTRGTPVFAGGGDGQAAGLGVNALRPERAYLNLGTAVVSGVYSREYRTGMAWRTMGSCSGAGYYFETSLRTGTFLVDWFVRKVCGVNTDKEPDIYERLEAEAAKVPLGSRGLMLLPYWGGVMTPYWDEEARGAILGFLEAHDRAHVYRALLEGIALDQALVTCMIEEEAGVAVDELVAIGGGAQSDLWCDIVANATGKCVLRSETVEASCLGAAVCAAVGSGWFSTMEEAAESMSGAITREFCPDPRRRGAYGELLDIYREIYPSLKETFRRLARFSQPD